MKKKRYFWLIAVWLCLFCFSSYGAAGQAPNELVILTLLLGLTYRVLSGWLRGDVLSSLLGSLGAFMITLVIFVCIIASAQRASHGIPHGVALYNVYRKIRKFF